MDSASVEPLGTDPATAPSAFAFQVRSPWREAWRRLVHNRAAVVAGAAVLAFVCIAIVGFTGALDSTIDYQYSAKGGEEPPQFTLDGKLSPAWWAGTDFLGQSVFWRMLYGARMALTVAILASLLEALIGVTLGLVAGYFGGMLDAFIVWLFSTVSSVPWILLIMAFAFVLKDQAADAAQAAASNIPLTYWQQFWRQSEQFLGKGVPAIVLAFGLTSWVGICRLIRGEVLKHRSKDYVASARAVGAGHIRIIFKHILPNVFHLVIINFALGLAGFVQAEVILSFLGLGVTDKPSWGRMIDDAKLELLKGVWWPLTAATIAIFAFSLAVNIFGDALRDALDPRLRGAD